MSFSFTARKTHVGTVVGVVVAIVVALATIMTVIYFVKKKNRRLPTSHDALTTSGTSAMAMTEVASNDDVGPMRLQFPPPGIQNDPLPSDSIIRRPFQSTGAPYPGSFLRMNVVHGAYPPPYEGMTVVEAPPPPYQ